MLKFERFSEEDSPAYSTVTLTFDQRVKSRQKVALDNGEPAGLFLPRGSALLRGQKIVAESGEVVEICAADEEVMNPLQK